MMQRLLLALEHPRALQVIAVLGMLLCLPALFNGLVLDDHLQRVMATDLSDAAPLLVRAPWDLYAFFPNDADWVRAARAAGAVPWYAAENLHVHFARPLSSLVLWAEWQAGAPRWLAHLHDLLWYGLLVWMTGAVYREVYSASAPRYITPTRAAGLAALIYACADGHGLAIGWTANRHATISLVFATACLLAHVRWRTTGSVRAAVAAPALLALGLASGEAALSITAYLFAWAVCLDRGGLRARVLSLVPCAAVGLLWVAWYRANGFGTAGSGLYLDPSAEPLLYLAALPSRFVLLVGAAVSPLQSDEALILPPLGYAVLVGMSALAVLGLVVWAARALRGSRTAAAFGLGAAVAALPVCAVFASDRNALVLTIGIAPVLVELIATGLREGASTWARRGAMALVACHLVLAPLGKPLRVRSSVWIGAMSVRACHSLDTAAQDLGGSELIVVSSPDFFFGPVAVMAYRPALGLPTPASMRSLQTGSGAVTIARVDDVTLEVRTSTYAADGLFDAVLRHQRAGFKVGDAFDAGAWRVQVLEVDDRSHATALRWTAPSSLDDPSRRWVTFTEHGYAPFEVPTVGDTAELPPVSLIDALFYGLGLQR